VAYAFCTLSGTPWQWSFKYFN